MKNALRLMETDIKKLTHRSFNIRVEETLLELLEEDCKSNERSLNKQINYILKQYYKS